MKQKQTLFINMQYFDFKCVKYNQLKSDFLTIINEKFLKQVDPNHLLGNDSKCLFYQGVEEKIRISYQKEKQQIKQLFSQIYPQNLTPLFCDLVKIKKVAFNNKKYSLLAMLCLIKQEDAANQQQWYWNEKHNYFLFPIVFADLHD